MHEKRTEIRKATHAEVPPLVTKDCHTLVLGSMLSPKSAQAKFYYAHPQNKFWRVLTALFGCDRMPQTSSERAQLVLSHGIALWDVVASCDIEGASDSTIKNVVYNDIVKLLDDYPKITRIFTTGKKAFELLTKYNDIHNNPIISKAVCLPSTSPQNFKTSFDELVAAYNAIK